MYESEGGPNILKVDEVKEFHNFKNQYEWLGKDSDYAQANVLS
jgi:hypothetical protein